MGAREARGLTVQLDRVRQRLERWRRTRKGRERIPEALWTSAVRVAKTVGIHRTARALRLDYYSLKKRAEGNAAGKERAKRKAAITAGRVSSERAGPTFLEVPPAAWTGPGECTMELEGAGGAKLRVHLKGFGPPDLAALSRSFWELRS